MRLSSRRILGLSSSRRNATGSLERAAPPAQCGGTPASSTLACVTASTSPERANRPRERRSSSPGGDRRSSVAAAASATTRLADGRDAWHCWLTLLEAGQEGRHQVEPWQCSRGSVIGCPVALTASRNNVEESRQRRVRHVGRELRIHARLAGVERPCRAAPDHFVDERTRRGRVPTARCPFLACRRGLAHSRRASCAGTPPSIRPPRRSCRV